jgi:hypothetical protein
VVSTSITTTTPTKDNATTTSIKAKVVPQAEQDGPNDCIDVTSPSRTPLSVTQSDEEIAKTPANDSTEVVLSEEPCPSAAELRSIQRTVEWYFSDANLSTSESLHHKISQHLPEGWLCCSEVLCLEQLKKLGVTPALLVKCLRKSHLETRVTLTADELSRAKGEPGEFRSRGVYVRRRQPLPPLLSSGVLNAGYSVDPARFVLVDRHQTLNRLRDQWRVQAQLGLGEVGDDTTVFRERVPAQFAQTQMQHPHNNFPIVFAVGYERIVYGDHGPYIELSESQIRWKAWPHYFDKRKYNSYFNEYYTRASHCVWESKWRRWDPNPTKGVLMLYAQSKSVSDRPWAPGAGSEPHAGRPNGYADYRPGYYYVAADESLVIAERLS